MVERGAPAAYRGYRLQILYTLARIFESSSMPSRKFHLEGIEDLDILDDGIYQELVQVKSSEDLSLSDLRPQADRSFLQRAIHKCRDSPSVHVTLVNFARFGSELNDAWNGDTQAQDRIRGKLNVYEFADSDISLLFDRVRLKQVSEGEILRRVSQQLSDQLTGIDPDAALDGLCHWLYRQAEERATVTHMQLIGKVTSVARYLAERYTHHQEWFVSIVPFEDESISDLRRPLLEREFLEGVDARYEHIVAGLDYRRSEKLQDISRAFQRSNVVIVHGPSGQGKSTLGYRYMHEHYPRMWRFQVRQVEDRQHALRIARALSGHARAIGAPIAVYLDVSSRYADWPELVKELATLDEIHILITIREEDLHRANISGAWFRHETVELTFTEAEARSLFERIAASGQARRFLSFEEAWEAFQAGGPLMEFVYLLTHTETLQERLEQQVYAIRERVSALPTNDELLLLRLVAVASAFGARIDLEPLRDAFATLDLEHTLRMYEQEYLIRLTQDERHVAGVHPIRSTLLVDLLTHSYTEPWEEAFAQVLPMIVDQDLEGFLFYALARRSAERRQIVEEACLLDAKTWTSLAAIGRALLWLGVKEYVDSLEDVLDEAHSAFGPAYALVLDSDLSELLQPETEDWIKSLGDLVPPETAQRLESLRARQPPKVLAFRYLQRWLARRRMCPRSPISPSDWSGAAFMLFWGGRLCPSRRPDEWISDKDLDRAAGGLPLPQVAELSAALFVCNRERHATWLNTWRPEINRRLTDEYGIVELEQTGDRLTVHFVVSGSNDKTQSDTLNEDKDYLHAQTMERVYLIRQLFPGHQYYGSYGYGHRFAGLMPKDYDPAEKNISVSLLHLDWEVQPNAWFHGLAHLRYRPDSWEQYIQETLDLRKEVVSCLEMICRGVFRYMQRRKPTNMLSEPLTVKRWLACRYRVAEPPALPKSVVDPWGFVYEGQSKDTQAGSRDRPNEGNSRHDGQRELHQRLISLARYSPYLESSQDYMRAISGFLTHAQGVAQQNYFAGKETNQERRANLLEMLYARGLHQNSTYLSTLNLNQAIDGLKAYQYEFRKQLGAIADAAQLAEIEDRECRVVEQISSLWYFFAHSPWLPWSNPSRQAKSMMQHERRRVYTSLERVCEQLDSGTATTMEGIPDWDGRPTLWLRLDIDHAPQLYTSVEQLIEALQNVLHTVDPKDPAHWIITSSMEYIVVVPVLRGQLIDRLGWKLHTVSALMRRKAIENHPWSYIPQQIPGPLLEAIGLPLCELDGMVVVNTLRSAVVSASWLVEHLADLARIPSISPEGEMHLMDYFSSQANLISQQLQDAIDAATEMIAFFTELPDAERSRSPYLADAVAGLRHLVPQLLPEVAPDSSGDRYLSLEAMVEFSQRLVESRTIAEVVRLHWIEDVLSKAAHSS